MPDWLLKSILLVFMIHSLVFAGLWHRRRKLALLLAAGAFFLLMLAMGLRLRWPESRLLGIRAHWFLRVPAWGLAVCGLAMGYRERRRKVRPDKI
ncbi:MAG TPA: hypothetical protein ENN66_09615 [Proteobacteria bacterium]|nr:hypothetical protein [Pseudomonadota bacterium]